MRKICAWCNRELNAGLPADAKTKHLVSHGICKDCSYHFLARDVGLPLQDYLNGLDTPVLVTDGDVVVKGANRKAYTVLGKELAQIEGLYGGRVFECEYAMLPEGCGKTIHCGGCVIRRSVTDSFVSHNPHTRVPACLNCRTSEGSQTVQLLISTVRSGDVVLLKVEMVSRETEKG